MAKDLIESFVEALKPDEKQTDSTYSAKVSKVDRDGIVWVYVAGSDKETPTASASTEVKLGDEVQVEWRNNKLYIAGNVTNPSAGSIRVNAVEQAAQIANQAAQNAVSDAGVARQAAEQAQESAQIAQNSIKSVVQGATTVEKAVSVMQTALEAVVDYDPATDTTQEYFWHDANGAHVLGTSGDYRADIKSTGMNIVDINTEKSVAEFGVDGSQIGQLGESRLNMNYRSLQLKDRDGYTYFYVSELLDKNGNITEESTGQLLIPDTHHVVIIDVGFDISAIVEVLADGVDVTSDTTFNQKIVTIANVTEPISNLVITYTPDSPSPWYNASYYKAYTLGIRSKAADGHVGGMSTVIGYSNDARGFASLAEGQVTTASGDSAHAEGYRTTAIGDYSHAQNHETIAGYDNQTAIGKYNDNQSNNAFEIGNGTSDNARSNAFEVDWNGNTTASGDITDGSGNVLSDKADTSIVPTMSAILDMFYPVGTYYETSLSEQDFDPNTAWGGTWVLDSQGRVTVSQDTTDTAFDVLGETGGEKTHTLTKNEMPAHDHDITFYYRNTVAYNSGSAARPYSKSGSSSTQNWADSSTEGGGQAHNNLQPYVVVNRWHRTA